MDKQIGEIPKMRPDMTMEERINIWVSISDMSEEEFRALMAKNKARQVHVPKVGSEAPDFELDVLDRSRRRTGERVRLSSMRGRPVGLIFGSYT